MRDYRAHSEADRRQEGRTLNAAFHPQSCLYENCLLEDADQTSFRGRLDGKLHHAPVRPHRRHLGTKMLPLPCTLGPSTWRRGAFRAGQAWESQSVRSSQLAAKNIPQASLRSTLCLLGCWSVGHTQPVNLSTPPFRPRRWRSSRAQSTVRSLRQHLRRIYESGFVALALSSADTQAEQKPC